MSAAPFMQLYVGDYLADTLHLSCEEHGAYLLLLMTMWRNGGSLPNDEKKLARIARLKPAKWRSVWESIEAFFTVEDGVITQGRLQKEITKAKEKSAVRKLAGAAGGRAKSLKNNETGLANASDLLKQGQISEPDIIQKETSNDVSQKVRGSRLKPDWALPSEFREWALSEGWTDAVISDQADRFKDHFLSASGAKGVKLDWLATWRNWMRRCRTPRVVGGTLAAVANGGRVSAAELLKDL